MSTGTHLNKPHGRSGSRTSVRTRSAYMLHLIRRARGLTMRQLAELTATNIETVCRWESGRRTPLRASSRLLSLVLECPSLAVWDNTPVERDPQLMREVEAWAADVTARPAKKKGPAPDRADPVPSP